jgi:hypothetical protein
MRRVGLECRGDLVRVSLGSDVTLVPIESARRL